MQPITTPGPLRATAIALLLTAPCFALADTAYANLNKVDPTVIQVRSNGSTYDGTLVPQVQLRGEADVHIDAGVSGRVKSWSVYLIAAPVDKSYWMQRFSDYKATTSYAPLNRPKTVTTTKWAAVPHSITRNWVINMCNIQADRLRKSGMSNQAIFGQDRALAYRVNMELDFETTGVAGPLTPGEVTSDGPNFQIVCKASAPVAPPAGGAAVGGGLPTNTPALLQQLDISMLHQTAPVQCPANVTAHMTFKADANQPPGYIRYRVRSLSGKASPQALLQFAASDRNGAHYVKSVSQPFLVGVPAAPAPATPAVGQQAAGGFAAPARPDPNNPVIGNSGLGGNAVGGGYASPGNPTPPNVHKDSMWIEVETAAQGSVMKSGYAAYTVTCAVVPTGVGGGAPGAVQGATSKPVPAPLSPARPAALQAPARPAPPTR